MDRFRAKGCHDCLLLGMCGNPKAHRDTDYCCKQWEWRHE